MLIIDLLFTYIATVAFGVLLNLPHRALNMAGLIGTLSFLAYKLLMMAHSGLVTANLVGAVLIGVLSMQAAKWLKMPVIIFNIPALVPFVPGGQAYQMVKNFALADNTVAFSFFVSSNRNCRCYCLWLFTGRIIYPVTTKVVRLAGQSAESK
ncbi:threonine/serine exporter family protein [Secundilactobacillus kimchicus]|uniref:threonine/serine exporter family protein n=1 Tax=Secundilactobacillus kimchicus TaxID=528209 RepID=UPI000B25D15E